MRILFEKNIGKLKRNTADCLRELIANNRDVPTLLMLAGGSALSLLSLVGTAEIGGNLTIAMSDERFSQDPKINNFAQLTETDFYKEASNHGANFIDSRPRGGETLAGFGKRIEHEMRKWKDENPKGKSIATFGIGEDGHTAGIMPFPENPSRFEELFESADWYSAYDASGKNPHALRTTTTMTFIRKMFPERIIFATGEGKRQALARLAAKEGSLAETPARIHLECPGAKLFTDIALA